MGVSVVLSGQVRDRAGFEQGLNRLVNLREKGFFDSIIYSTWHSEIENYDGLDAALEKLGVRVIKSRPPELLLDFYVNPPPAKSVTILQQIKSLRLGIELCPDDNWIFRLRPDTIPGDECLIDTISNLDGMEATPPPGWPSVFEKKIVVLGGLCFHPMFLVDTCYFGYKRDLKKIVHPNIYAQTFGLRMNCEQHLFGTRFFESFPILSQFFLVNAGMQHYSREMAEQVESLSLSDPYYLKALATYYLIVQNYFHAGFHKRSATLADEMRKKNLPDSMTYEQFLSSALAGLIDGVTYFDPGKTLYFSYAYWIDHLVEGRFASSPVGDALKQAINEMKDIKSQDRYQDFLVRTDTEAKQFRDKLLALNPRLAIYSSDYPETSGLNVTIQGRLMQASILPETR